MKRLCLLILAVAGFSWSGAAAQEPADAPVIVGHVAYIGTDNNVYVIGGKGDDPAALTEDADSTRRYQFPTWSTDGRLAFFCCDISVTPRGITLETYVATPDLTAAKLLYSMEDEGYTYAYWSPANCDAGPECRDLAVLVTRPDEPFKVEVIRQNGSDVTSWTASTGAPFYLSWNADGNRMLWHRNNRSVSIYDSAENEITSELLVAPGFFFAPSWSPVDDRAAMGLLETSGSTTALVVVDGEEQTILLQGIRGISSFSWSPDGAYIAHRVLGSSSASPLQVIDARTGEIVATSSEANVFSFFWSPDGRKIAYVTVGQPEASRQSASLVPVRAQQNQVTLSWSLLDIEAETSRSLASFSPTASMLYLLTYFDQFNQSHQIWSPDSRYIVYGDAVAGTSPVVSILDTSVVGPVPWAVADGLIGIWSYQ